MAGSKTISISPKSLHFSRYFVMQPARQSRSARGRSSYRKESTYSHMQVNLRVYSELFSARLFIKQCQSCGKNHPASPRASHYKTKEIEKNLSKLNFFLFLLFCIALFFASTPSRNRTYNCPLGGGCYIHLTMRACRLESFEPEYQNM